MAERAAAQRVVVDIGGVDLDAPPQLIDPHRLREQHCEGVGLLAGRAPGTPNPDRLVVGPLLEQPRHDLVLHVLPRVAVAQKRRDVDQDGVEQRGELLGMDLEVVAVGEHFLDAHLGHALGNPTLSDARL
ncbi:MAG TPA: hypothetical protein VM307_02930 [Egibacteraceae bacterium]|nr:hypothetical protein [Egibacteraceae bacterium]